MVLILSILRLLVLKWLVLKVGFYYMLLVLVWHEAKLCARFLLITARTCGIDHEFALNQVYQRASRSHLPVQKRKQHILEHTDELKFYFLVIELDVIFNTTCILMDRPFHCKKWPKLWGWRFAYQILQKGKTPRCISSALLLGFA